MKEWDLYYNVLFKGWLVSFKVGVKRTCLILMYTWAFYSLKSGRYNETQGSTGGIGAGKTLCSKTLMARTSKWCLQRREHPWSCRLPRYTRLAVWRRAVKLLNRVAVPNEWYIVLAPHCSRTVATYLHVLHALTMMAASTSYRPMMTLTSGALETCTRALGRA
jgi:hypothetical protein